MFVMKKSAFIIILLLISIVFNTYADEIQSSSFIIKGDNLSAGGGDGTAPSFNALVDINPFSDLSTSASFSQEVGYNPRIRANTPYAPTLVNDAQYYDRLKITIDSSDNPTDTLFAVAISDDNFATVNYVQNDGTIAATLGTEDYRTYTSWGGASGSFILGLNQNTTYKVRSKALHGDFTETGYSNDSSEATTLVPFINLVVSDNSVTFGTLSSFSIATTTSVNVTVNTNSYNGYQAYINDQGNGVNGGLYNGSSTITSADMTLTPGTEGYGAQASSGSAFIDTKYDVSGNQVGGLDVSTNTLFNNTSAVTGEFSTVVFKATISGQTQSGIYSDIVYFTVSPII